MWKFLIPAVIISFLLEPLFSLPFLFLVVIAVSSSYDSKTSITISFICGLLTDISYGKPIGASILYFLIVSFIITFYRHRFTEESLTFLFFSSLLFVNVYYIFFIGNSYIFLIQSFISSVIVIPLTLVFLNLKPRSSIT